MPFSDFASLKSLPIFAMLGGSLVFAVLSLDAPAWRRWTTTSGDAAEGGQPAPFRADANEALPLDAPDAAAVDDRDDDADSHGEGEPNDGGALLALALSDADDSEPQVVETVVGEADDGAIAPVFWGDALPEEEPASQESGEFADDDEDRTEYPAEPGLLMVDPDTGTPLAVPGNEGGDELSRDRFSALERRLRELGATHYRLETWGAEGELFRFRCWMAVSEAERYNRFFEATDADALAAFEKVLADVEQWRARQARGR